MTKRAFKFLILTGLINGVVCAVFGTNIAVSIKMSWSEARNYCRELHTDLSSVNSPEEDEELYTIEHEPGPPYVWIGLYKDASGTWKWSGGGTASYFNWLTNPVEEDGSCVVHSTKGWDRKDCEKNQLRFYCFRSSLVLVEEKKTWEEAMEHCRQQNRDLVSLTTSTALIKTLQTSREAHTDYVWTGLRYLAGSWLWVNGSGIEYQAWSQGEMPQCPKRSHHCGALSLEKQRWVGRDCEEKINFVCY
ncbi:macrophage mannose receptor 1-like [Hippoglossus hippoglossus]|uniref:macrophage mannose receptor 1-like n=1 Tax=Hippoglossus hippoglossus TaxID=8267 RepID=UPI00148DBE34|nr:macrophage mannose receptor 1-like [Hippoglossus hippoglossus]